MTKKVCISGYYGFDNFGDETILSVLIENLKKFECTPEITVFSSNPNKTSETHNVKSIQSFDIKKVIRELKNCDCLISGGGSLLQDVTSIKSLIYYLGIISIAQFFRKKTIIFAQGIGPIKNNILRYITFKIIKKCNLITVRDEISHKLLKNKNINAIKCNDPVWNISTLQIEKKETLGIQLRECSNLNSEFLLKLATSINKHYSEKQIKIFSLQNKLDIEVCNKFKNILVELNPNINVEVIENTSNAKIINDIAELNELIAMRFHACLIALKTNTNVLPINYDIKVETLAKEFDLNTLSLNELNNIDKTIEKFKNTNINISNEKLKDFCYNFKELENYI